ncbi:MAG TPA: mannosyltransferase family protein [Devosia sp.]|nr:mannosyltransferase family protein [Devosia sp.]
MSAADTAAAANPTGRAFLLRLVRSDAAIVAGLFLGSRGLLLLIGYLTLALVPGAHAAGPLLPNLFVHWDSDWYLQIAAQGYTRAEAPGQPGATSFAFYPLLPLLMRALHQITGLPLPLSGVLLSNIALCIALMVVVELGAAVTGDRRNGLMSAALLSFVPEGFVFSAIYTESLFLLLTAGSMLAFARQRYVASALLAALNSTVRTNGVLVAAYYLLDILRRRGLKGALRVWERPEEYLPAIAAPLGLVLFWWFAFLVTGDAFAQKSTVLHGWGWAPALPWTNVLTYLASGALTDRFWVVSALISLALSFTLLRREYWPLFAYCLLNFALYLTGATANSLLRYSITILPIYFGVSLHLVRRPLLAGIAFGAMALLGGFLMAAWALGLNITT